MGLLSISGRFLFASFFIFSACLTGKEIIADAELVGKEYGAKMAGLQDLSETERMKIVCFFISFFMCQKVIGGFLLIFGLQILSALFLGMYLLMAIPIFCGFYHYKVGEPMFIILFQDFVQNVSFIGALMFFIEMKYEVSMMQKNMMQKKKTPKSKRLKRSKED